MRHRRLRARRITDGAALGLALAASACASRDPGFVLDDGETGDADSSGETQSEAGTDDAGTDGSNDIHFELVSARLDATGQVVTLTFSEPVGPVGQVDPADFRISFASIESLCSGNGCDDITTYRDPNFFVAQYWDYSAPQYDRFDLIQIVPGAQAKEVVLQFAASLESQICDAIDYYDMSSPGSEYDVGLFVHHSPGAIPLTSADGESLESFGAQWVEQAPQNPPVWFTDGIYPDLDPMIEIPCTI